MSHLSWVSIFRLGLVQWCLGAIVVLTTSTLNRLMVVEAALPAVLPGLLVGLHYAVQLSRPTWGYRSDTGGNRTMFILLGMALLALGGFLAAAGFVVMTNAFWPGLALSVVAYALIGVGVGASGTSLLALLATATHPQRRPAAATIT
jgi:BCD family chlorophyll transporter-like MFS transporter